MNDTGHITFRFSPQRMTLWAFLFAVLTAGCLWMAWRSFDPHFYDHSTGRYAWAGDLLRDSPVWLRIGVWVACALLFALGGSTFLRRWISGIAPLVLSPQGITGFTGAGLERCTIAWRDVGNISASRSNLIVNGTPVDQGGVRRPKAPTIAVNMAMIGEKFALLMEKIRGYHASLSSASGIAPPGP